MFDPTFIGIYDKALSSFQCKEIIEYIESRELVKGFHHICNEEELGNVVDNNIKDDWEVPHEDTYFPNVKNHDLYLIKALGKATLQYRESYMDIDRTSHWRHCDAYNLQKYEPGQGYHSLHCENGGPGNHRILAWMVYLNTFTDRGETYFSSYDRFVKAKEGRLVIWPAFWTHCHKGIVSKTQTKYIATGWYEYITDADKT